MRRVGIHAIVLMLALAAAAPLGGSEAPAGTGTFKGELVDARCFLTAGKRGADHRKCASICLKDNLPAGLVTGDDKFYTLIIQPAALADVVSLEAEVTGTLHGDSIVPTAVKVLKDGKWEEVKLPEPMM